jgi:hypothetical protein
VVGAENNSIPDNYSYINRTHSFCPLLLDSISDRSTFPQGPQEKTALGCVKVEVDMGCVKVEKTALSNASSSSETKSTNLTFD